MTTLVRALSTLADDSFDLLVVGGGIVGACLAREAAMSGISTAIIDRDDFGGGTSHNSLKLIHGGVRYLQHLDLPRLRQSVAERRFWMATAGHLVRPLKFVMPAYGHGGKGREVLWAGMHVYNLLSADRNRGVDTSNHLPSAGMLPGSALKTLIPGVDDSGVSGVAMWYDGQMVDADRVLISCLKQASEHGAVMANHVAAERLLWDGDRVIGVQAHDQLSGESFPLRAGVTINAAGPWADGLIRPAQRPLTSPTPSLSKCMNVVTRPLVEGDYAFGLRSSRRADAVVGGGRRMFFVTPWRGRSIIGTSHLPYPGKADDCRFTEADVSAFIAEINEAWPQAAITLSDVEYCYGGLTPAGDGLEGGEVRRARRSAIVDHQRSDGVTGLITAMGVKYTTARAVAREALSLARKQGGWSAPVGSGNAEGVEARLPDVLSGNQLASQKQALESTLHAADHVEARAVAEFVEAYGASSSRVAGELARNNLRLVDHLDRCRCAHAVRAEMARTLDDVLQRRLHLPSGESPTDALVRWCAGFMATELDWSTAERDRMVSSYYSKIQLMKE